MRTAKAKLKRYHLFQMKQMHSNTMQYIWKIQYSANGMNLDLCKITKSTRRKLHFIWPNIVCPLRALPLLFNRHTFTTMLRAIIRQINWMYVCVILWLYYRKQKKNSNYNRVRWICLEAFNPLRVYLTDVCFTGCSVHCPVHTWSLYVRMSSVLSKDCYMVAVFHPDTHTHTLT